MQLREDLGGIDRADRGLIQQSSYRFSSVFLIDDGKDCR